MRHRRAASRCARATPSPATTAVGWPTASRPGRRSPSPAPGANNGSFVIEKVSKGTLTLAPSAALTDGTATNTTVTTDPLAATGVIRAGDDIDVQALASPQIYSFALAGSQSTQKDQAEATGGAATSGSPSAVADAAGNTGGGGVGISGSASVNTVDMTTTAKVDNVISVTAQDLRVVANTATGTPRLSDSPTLTFATNGTGADTVSRSSGSWLAEGFRPGQALEGERAPRRTTAPGASRR
jgi:hypothetical protein